MLSERDFQIIILQNYTDHLAAPLDFVLDPVNFMKGSKLGFKFWTQVHFHHQGKPEQAEELEEAFTDLLCCH